MEESILTLFVQFAVNKSSTIKVAGFKVTAALLQGRGSGAFTERAGLFLLKLLV